MPSRVNIPTDLLRTLVTVIDQRSFTRAARTLGLSQPAVSAHIKRLQAMLGNDLFARPGSGLNLTAKGELVVNYARRLLSINDLIVNVTEPNPGAQTIRIGVPEDFLGGSLPRPLAEFRKQRPDLRFSLRNGGLEPLVSELRQGELDIVIGLSSTEPAIDARHHWTEQTVWLRGRSTRLSATGPVPLVSFGEDCVYHRTAVCALNQSGRCSELVFTGPTIASLAAAVAAGLGIMALPRSRVRSPDLKIWREAPLPKLSDLVWEVYLREGAKRGPAEELADLITAALRRSSAGAIRSTAAGGPKPGTAFARRAAIN